ncbi:unnamed protein product [Victoria cruziana]
MQRIGRALGFGGASVGPCVSPRRAIQKVSRAVCGSNIQLCGLAFAALPDSSKPKKQWKRLPKHERRLLVEKFVHKYRTSNNGKFPGAQLTMKEVGGSYYVIREIIQEMEYKHKCLGMDKVDELKLESVDVQPLEAHAEGQSVIEFQDVSIPVADSGISFEKSDTAQIVTPVDDRRSSDSSLITEEAEERPELSLTDEAGIAKGVAEGSCLESQAAAIITAGDELSTVPCEAHAPEDSTVGQTVSDELLPSSPKPESSVNDMLLALGPGEPPASKEIENAPEKLLDLDTTEKKDPCDNERPKRENLQRELPTKTDLETAPSSVKQKTFWGSLKALAGGIINYWTKK